MTPAHPIASFCDAILSGERWGAQGPTLKERWQVAEAAELAVMKARTRGDEYALEERMAADANDNFRAALAELLKPHGLSVEQVMERIS